MHINFESAAASDRYRDEDTGHRVNKNIGYHEFPLTECRQRGSWCVLSGQLITANPQQMSKVTPDKVTAKNK